jgi:hypothetical protein
MAGADACACGDRAAYPRRTPPTHPAHWYSARLTILHVVPTFDPVQVRSQALTGAVRIE